MAAIATPSLSGLSPSHSLHQTSHRNERASPSTSAAAQSSCISYRCHSRSRRMDSRLSMLSASSQRSPVCKLATVFGYGGQSRSLVPRMRRRGGGQAVAVMAPEKESAMEPLTDAPMPRISGSRPRDAIEAAIRAKELMGKKDTYLLSTNTHRAWVGFGVTALGSLLGKAVLEVHSYEAATVCTASILAAYLLADLGTGIYHWSVDNYGDANTPVVGPQIDAFQGHHRRPWTITKREFSNNLHALARPIGFCALPFLLAPSNVGLDAFVSTFLSCVMFSQLFHAWSHCKKSELPPAVLLLQDSGVLISRKAHGAHHRPPFNINYCIVSGAWNGLLKDSGFFKSLELAIFQRTGIAPRSWSEAAADWEIYETTTYFEDGNLDESENLRQ